MYKRIDFYYIKGRHLGRLIYSGILKIVVVLPNPKDALKKFCQTDHFVLQVETGMKLIVKFEKIKKLFSDNLQNFT